MKTKLLLPLFLCMLWFSSAGQNLLENGGFESDFTQWTNLASDNSVATFTLETSDKQEGQKAMKVTITTPGTNDWSVQSIHNAWPSVKGAEYRLRLYAKASSAGTILRAVQQVSDYAAYDFTLTTDWKLYEWVFTAKESNLQLKFHFLKQQATIFIDNITIEPTTPIVIPDKDTFRINPATRFQTMEGFGAAQAYYESWVTAHPNKNELYKLAFQDLGLDWLRIQNVYRGEGNFQPDVKEIVEQAKVYADDSIRIYMTSWSPPADIKSNNNIAGGTLKKANDHYMYDAFGDYWKDALTAYAAVGIKPDWISIQNEPDFEAPWATNKLSPTETAEFAGYDQALDSVYKKIKDLPDRPRLIGAETAGISISTFNAYSNAIKDKEGLFGYAYHLYNGGDSKSPDSYSAALSNIGQIYKNKPNFMTEFEDSSAGWLKSAWMISNTLTLANASAYFYWDLMWENHGLIDIDFPWDQTKWENSKGYTVTPFYYAVKHFSKYIKPGYIRVSGSNTNDVIRSSVFINPQENKMVVVFINTSSTDITTKIDPMGKHISASAVIQSVEDNYDQSKGSLSNEMTVALPAHSVTTVAMDIKNCTSLTTNAGNDQTICSNASATLSGSVNGGPTGGTWQSSGTGSFSPASTNLHASYQPSAADISAGNVTLTLTATGTSCHLNDDVKITIEACTGVRSGLASDMISVYPIPAHSVLSMDLTHQPDIEEASVTNAMGTVIKTVTIDRLVYCIDLGDLPSGQYFLVLKSSQGNRWIKHFIKE